MNWLQAALAFALVMLVLATIVTIILEAGYRVLLTREKSFRLMMERIFDEVLKPRIAHRLRGVTVAQARQHFLDAVTQNQAYERKLNRVREFIQPNQLSSMTMMQFADRLADTEVGKAIASAGTEYVDNAINDLAQKFERFGAAASQRFQDHARFWCVLASVLLAFVANVDAVRMFQGLLHDDALTSGIIAKYGDAVSDGAPRPQDAVESLKALEELKAAGAEISDDQIKEFKKSLATAQLKIVELRDTGLPITVEYWPFCTGELGKTGRAAQPEEQAAGSKGAGEEKPAGKRKPADPKCGDTLTENLFSLKGAQEVCARACTSAGGQWLFSVVLAGFLIGLGAPFWFDLARGLTRSAQLLRAAGVGQKEDKAPPAPTADASASPPPRTPVEAFKVAIVAARPARARILLAANGRPTIGGRP